MRGILWGQNESYMGEIRRRCRREKNSNAEKAQIPKMVAGRLRPEATATQVNRMMPKKPTSVPTSARTRKRDAIFAREAGLTAEKRG